MFNSKRNQTLELLIDQIVPNPDQPRKTFDDDTLTELSASIKVYGVLQPVLVRKSDANSYILIAGERRYRAALLAGQKRIPAIVKTLDEKDSAMIALTENVQRENLNYFEEAAAYAHLIDEYHITQSEISRLVGKQQSTISNKIRLLSLSPEIKQLLLVHNLTERHARALLSVVGESKRQEVLHTIIENTLNINQTESLISSLAYPSKDKVVNPKFINYKIYVNTLKQAFSSIKKMAASAEFSQRDMGDFVEVTILIPKAKADISA